MKNVPRDGSCKKFFNEVVSGSEFNLLQFVRGVKKEEVKLAARIFICSSCPRRGSVRRNESGVNGGKHCVNVQVAFVRSTLGTAGTW